MRLLVVNGNRTEAVTERAVRVAAQAASVGTVITGATAAFGADYVRSRADEVIAAHAVLDALAQHAGTFDAAVLAISLDSGLLAARQLVPVPVVGMTEAALHFACQLAERVGVITSGLETRPLYFDLFRRYGLESRIAELRTLDTSGHAEPLSEDALVALLRDEAWALARNPSIGCIVLCGAVHAGLAERIAPSLPVPILDCMAVAVAQAEVLARLTPSGGRRSLARGLQMAGLSPALMRAFHESGHQTERRAAPSNSGLAALEERLRHELRCLDAPNRSWVPPRRTQDGSEVLDVLIIGGGQSGLAIAWALRRERVERVQIVDENPAGLAGPWLRFARMKTLRTPKELTGPDLGVPSLTFRAWYEAQHGAAAWDSLALIPREQWAAYLDWYRSVLELPVQFDTQAGALRPAEDGCLIVPLRHAGSERLVRARKVVLANGIEGSGAWLAPPALTAHLPRQVWAHTQEDIDFSRLAGKRVAVLGAGASAFDNALVALAHGAASVELCFRRPELVRVDAFRFCDFTGFLNHHHELPDLDRYRFMAQIARMGQLPPANTYHSAVRDPRFRMRPGTPWERTEYDGEQVRIQTPHGLLHADFLIIGTGFRTDLQLRPELVHLEPHIARWADRFTPPAGPPGPSDPAEEDLLRHPYLGPSYEFLERTPGQAPYVSSVFAFNYGALLSHGFGAAGLTGFRYTVPRLVAGITGQLYIEDRAHHLRELSLFNEQDF